MVSGLPRLDSTKGVGKAQPFEFGGALTPPSPPPGRPFLPCAGDPSCIKSSRRLHQHRHQRQHQQIPGPYGLFSFLVPNQGPRVPRVHSPLPTTTPATTPTTTTATTTTAAMHQSPPSSAFPFLHITGTHHISLTRLPPRQAPVPCNLVHCFF